MILTKHNFYISNIFLQFVFSDIIEDRNEMNIDSPVAMFPQVKAVKVDILCRGWPEVH